MRKRENFTKDWWLKDPIYWLKVYFKYLKIRIKPKGGDGSHRGLENIIYVSNTDNIPRLRFGIGTSEKMRPAENYVLEPFKNGNDKTLSRKTVKNAADALDSIVFNGLDRTMNIYNS